MPTEVLLRDLCATGSVINGDDIVILLKCRAAYQLEQLTLPFFSCRSRMALVANAFVLWQSGGQQQHHRNYGRTKMHHHIDHYTCRGEV